MKSESGFSLAIASQPFHEMAGREQVTSKGPFSTTDEISKEVWPKKSSSDPASKSNTWLLIVRKLRDR